MNKFLIEKMRRVYTNRLLEALKEVDLVDNEGNVLISKDLKVFHKDSGYEYTVDDVLKTPEGIKVVLREPDDPRFNPPPSSDILDEVMLDIEDVEVDGSDASSEEEVLFVVDEKTFEKEYEVK